MTETEFDEMMTSEIRKLVVGRRLPDDFSGRLAQSAKTARIAWRVKTIICITAVTALGISIIGISRGTETSATSEPMLMAADAPSSTTEVSSWFLLGYLRECLRRNRTNKKKEEN